MTLISVLVESMPKRIKRGISTTESSKITSEKTSSNDVAASVDSSGTEGDLEEVGEFVQFFDGGERMDESAGRIGEVPLAWRFSGFFEFCAVCDSICQGHFHWSRTKFVFACNGQR